MLSARLQESQASPQPCTCPQPLDPAHLTCVSWHGAAGPWQLPCL